MSKEVRALEKQLDDLRTALAGAGLSIHVTDAGDGAFDLEVRAEAKVDVPAGVKASCWPSAVSSAGVTFQTVAAGAGMARFPAVSLAGVTAFLAFKLSGSVAGQPLEVGFVLTLPLVGAPEGRREHVLRSLVKDRSRMLRFLWLLLADDAADVPALPEGRSGGRQDESDAVVSSFYTGGLFEALLRNLDRSPERLDYLHELVAELRKNEQEPDLFPEGFNEIWLPIWGERLRQKAAGTR